MDRLVRRTALAAPLLSLAAGLAAQPLPTPGAFVRFLDLRCYNIQDQPPLDDL